MSRIYSNYEPNDYADIQAMSKDLGFTMSAFQKYCVMLYLNKNLSHRKNNSTLQQLTADMMTALDALPNDTQFIVSTLFSAEVWTNLSPSDKRTLAGQLSNFVKANPNQYIVVSNVSGEVKRYKKL